MTRPGSGELGAALQAEGVQVAVGPLTVRLRSELPSVLTHLNLLYPDHPIRVGGGGHFDLAIVAGSGAHRWVHRQADIVIDGARPFLPLPAKLAGPLMEWGLNWCIGKKAHRWTTLHAAVVERAGRVMIMPAPSGSGKSTLCAALAYSGWRLFSDEFALVDPETLTVFPAPRPLSLKNAAIGIIRQRHPDVVYGPEERDVEGVRFVHARPPADAVKRAAEGAAPGWIVLPRYSAGAPTSIVPLPRSQALIEIADQSFNYNCLGATGYASMAELVRRSECYRLEYSDLDDVLSRLATLTAG